MRLGLEMRLSSFPFDIIHEICLIRDSCTEEQGADLIDLRLTWREMEDLIFGEFLRIFGDFLRNFGEIGSL